MLELIKRYRWLLLFLLVTMANLIGFIMEEVRKPSIEFELESTVRKDSHLAEVEEKGLETVELIESNKNVVEEQEVPVYICGAVQSPGIYYVKSSAIVNDVLQLGGGFTTEAYKEGVNLARTITGHEKIYIPFKEEASDLSVVVEDLNDSSQINDRNEGYGKVNINLAGESELMTLPNIGEVKAKAIINYRETIGVFKTIEEVMNVVGIGEKTFERLKDFISV